MLDAKKIIKLVILVYLAIVLIFFLINTLNRTELKISCAQPCDIYTSLERGGEFSLLGENDATYVTDKSEVVYIQAIQGTLRTLSAVQLNRGESSEKIIQFTETNQPEKVAERSLSSLLIEDDFAYGVNPRTQSLGFAPLSSDVSPNFSYFGLPRISRVYWKNSSNFIYKSTFGEIGLVTNGSQASLVLPSGISTSSLYDVTESADGKQYILGQSAVLELVDNKTAQIIADISNLQVMFEARIFTDENNIYVTSPVFEDFAQDEENNEPEYTTLSVFTFEGELLSQQDLDIHQRISDVFQLTTGEVLMVGSSDIILLGNDGELSYQPYAFQVLIDSMIVDQVTYMLSGDGVWQYLVESNSFQLLSPSPVGEIYNPNSLFIQDKYIYFSTRIMDGQDLRGSTESDNAIYRLEI